MNKKAISLIYIIVLLSISSVSIADDLYWRPGASGDWNDPLNWTNQPGGNQNPTLAIPTFADNVFFTEHSFPNAGAEVVINDVAQCANMDWSGVTNLPTLKDSGDPAHSLTIFGGLKLAPDMYLDLLSPLKFSAKELGNEIDFAGHTFNDDIFFTKNGGWIIKTPLHVLNHNIYLEQGHLSFEASIECAQFIADNPTSRSLNLNNSTITLTKSGASALSINTDNLSLNPGSSTIIASGNNSGITISGSESTSLHNIEFQKSGAAIINEATQVEFNDVIFNSGGSLSGANQFHDLTFTEGNDYQILNSADQTILGVFTALGSCSKHINISGPSSRGSIIANSSSLRRLKVQNIDASGAATFNTPKSFDLGGTSGWNIMPPTAESFNWLGTLDSKWNTPDNWDRGCVPTRIDQVTINGTFNVDIDANAECQNLTLSDNVTLTGSSKLSIFGSLDAGNATWSLLGPTYFEGTANQTILINDSFKADVYFSGNGTRELNSDLKIPNNSLHLESGNFISNNKAIELNRFVSIGDHNRSLDLGTSTVRLNGNSLKTWDIEGSHFSIIETQHTIELINPKAEFYHNHSTTIKYNKVHFTDDREKANLTNEYSVISFEEVKFLAGANISGNHNYVKFILSAGKTYLFAAGSQQRITDINGFIAHGTCADFIYLKGYGGISTIVSDVQSNEIEYVQISDIEVTDGAGTIKDPGLKAQSSFGLSNYNGWDIAVKSTSEDFKWTGADDSDWFNPLNWDKGCVPTRVDNVFFDEANIAAGGNKTISVNGTREPECHNMIWSNATNLSFDGNTNIHIFGSLDFSTLPTASFNYSGVICFKSENDINVKLDQVSLANDVIFIGTQQEDNSWKAGTWTFDSQFVTTGNIELERGHLVSNNWEITCNELYSNYESVRSLSLGSSTLNLNGIYLTSKDLTFDAGTSEIKVDENGKIEVTNGDEPLAFNNISFTEETGTAQFSIRNSKVSFNQIDVKSNASYSHKGFNVENLILNQGKTYQFSHGETYNIGDITAVGACEGTIDISSLSAGTNTTFHSKNDAPISVTQVNLIDVHASPLGKFTANNSIDLGNNNGWTFTSTPVGRNLYWVGGTGIWDDPMHWSETSGGAPGACVPTSLDNVYFDMQSFTGRDQIVSTGSGDIRCRTMDWTGSEGTFPIFQTGATDISSVYIYGSLILNANMTVDLPDLVDFYFRSTENNNSLVLYDFVFPNNVIFNGENGKWTLANHLNIEGNLILEQGHFISAGYNISCNSFESKDGSLNGIIRTLDIQNSTVTVLGSEDYSVKIAVSAFFNSQSLTLLTDNSEIIIEKETGFSIAGQYTSNASFNTIRFLKDGNLTSENLLTRINNLIYEEGGEIKPGFIGDVTFDIGKLTLNKGTKPNTFKFYSGTTFPIEEFTALGSCNFPINIQGSTSGSQANLEIKTSVNADFIELTDINGVGSDVTYLATNSLEHTNVTNWTVNPITSVDLYWVGNGLNDEWSNYLNWSKTSGGVSEGCIPTELDNVFFDNKSFLGSKIALINSDAKCHNITWTDDVDPESTFKVQNELSVHGSLDFSENMSLDMSANLKFKGDGLTADKPIDFAGKTLGGNIYFNGENQSWLLQNDLSTTGNLILEDGALNTQANKMSISTFTTVNTPTNNIKLDVSGSKITVNADQYDSWKMISTGLPLDFTAVNSELYFPNKGGINCESPNDLKFGDAVFDSYGQIKINENGPDAGKGQFKTVRFLEQGQIFGDHTISNLEFTLGYGENTIQAGKTIQLTGDLVMLGVKCSYIHLKSSESGTQAYIHSTGLQKIYNASLEDIKMTDTHDHRVVGNYINVDNSSEGWTLTPDSSPDDNPPSFHENYPIPKEQWCDNTLLLDHVLHFPINDKTEFKWHRSIDGTAGTFNELPGETAATIVVDQNGYYQVELIYNETCKIPSTIQVIMYSTSNMIIDFTPTNVQCYGAADGFINAKVTNGYEPFDFFWTNEAGAEVPSSSTVGARESDAPNLLPGKYTLKVLDGKSCVQTSSTEIFDAYEMYLETTKTDLKCFNVSDGEININATGGTGALSYYLDGDLESSHITGLSAGEYLVHIQDENDCSSDEESVELLSPDEITFDFLGSKILCAGDDSGSIDPQVSGGVIPYNYKWTGSNGYSSGDPIISNLEGAEYSIEITDANNCKYSSLFDLYEPEEIIINDLIIADANCYGEETGKIFIEAEKGTAPYDYSISETNSNETGQFANLAEGTYSLEVTDDNNCKKSKEYTINEPDEMNFVVADNISPTCNTLKDGIINIVPYGGNGDYTFAWSGPNDFRSTSKNNTDLDFGEYTLLLKDQKECAREGIVNLIKKPSLQLGLIIVEEVSARGARDGSFMLEIIGGTPEYSYTVSGPNGYTNFSPTFFNDDQATFENLTGGLYTVTINDKSSCTSITKDIMMPEGDLLVSQIINQEDISCTGYNNGALNASAIGGNNSYSYYWSGPSGFTASTKSISALSAGTYTLRVESGGQTATNQTIILEPTPLEASTSFTDMACFNEPNGSIKLDISGGTQPYSVLWEADRGFYSHADKIYDLAKGDYHYQVKDSRGCIVSNSVTIGEPDILEVSQVHDDITDDDHNGTITATAVGGSMPYTIFISGPNAYSRKDFSNTTGIYSVNNLAQGVYVIEVLDAHGCRAITETRIFQQEKMIVSLVDKTTPICHGGSEGSIEVLIEDGSGDFTLSWEADNLYTNDDAPLKIDNLKAGNYTLTVTDNVTSEVIIFKQEVKEPDMVQIEYGVDHISCFGLTNGYINIYPKGGTPNYTYQWENIEASRINLEDQGGLSAGSYKVKVRDANACEAEEIIEIIEPELFSGSSTMKEPVCFGEKNGEIKLQITTGASPYTVNWNTGAVSNDISNLGAGTYKYTAVDNENCKFEGSVDLTQPDTLIAEINIFNDVICYGQNNGEASATVTGGTLPYDFNWSNGETTADMSGLRPNKYNLIVTDKNHCEDTASIIIEEPEELVLRIEANRPTVEGANDGEIFAAALGGTPDYATTWEMEADGEVWTLLPETDLEMSDLDRGKYKLAVSDLNLCTSDTIINLEYLYDRTIDIPKSFTPNQDGYNDYWDIHRIEYIQRLTIIIYDRLGAIVYQFSGTGNEYKGNPWTGANKSSHLPIGSYYYAIEADDSKPLTGSVTIAR